jgi:hypothetical protein
MASRLAAIDLIRDRLLQIKGAPERVAQKAAPLIEQKLRRDATTKRGNVPSFGKFGDVPIVANPTPNSIEVNAPDWVLKIAQERGQIDQFTGIVLEVAAQEMGSNK